MAAGYRGFVCDLDGVVRRGSAPVPYAAEQLAGLAAPVVFATNNASLTPAQVARQLLELGLEARLARPEAVVTSSEAGAAHLADLLPTGSRVLAVGGPGVAEAVRASGLRAVTGAEPGEAHTAVDAVLQGYGPQVTASDLARASYAIQAGAMWVATNLDATLPTQEGRAPGNGALVGAVAVATGTRPVAVGKPQPPLYDLSVSRLGCRPADALAIGDRLDTDILGAMAAGLDSLWVLTGVDTLVSFAASGERATPTYAAVDLRCLTRPVPIVRRVGATWVSGSVSLEVDWATGTVVVDGSAGGDAAAVHGPGPGRRADRKDPVETANALVTAAVAALVHARDVEGASPEVRVRLAERVTTELADVAGLPGRSRQAPR